jgi:hypothetical protein
VGIASAALFLVLVSSLASAIEESSRLQRVSVDQSAAMNWIAAETDPETTFIVATTVAWGWDEFSEWFPAVAHRRSLATVQGSEWLGPDGFEENLDRHLHVLACTPLHVSCVAEWATSAGFADAWIVIPKGQLNGPLSASECCPALRDSVRAGSLYEVVYDGAGATVARPVDEED